MTRPHIPRIPESDRAVRHPDFGRLVRDESTDTVICHVYGRAFRSMGHMCACTG